MKLLRGLVIIAFLVGLVAFAAWLIHPQKFSDRVRRLISAGKYQEAESLILEELQRRKYDPNLYILLGETYTAWGRYDQALKQFLSVPPRGLDEETKTALLNGLLGLADSSRKIGRVITAKKAYEYALQVEPDVDLGEGFKFLGDYYFDRHTYPQAALYYEEYLKHGGRKELVLDKLVRALYEIDAYEDVIKLHNDIVQLGSSKSQRYLQFAYYQAAKKAFLQKKFQDAIELLDKFFQLGSPKYVWEDATMLKARCLLAIGDTSSAIEQLQRIAAFGTTVNREAAQALLDSLNIGGAQENNSFRFPSY